MRRKGIVIHITNLTLKEKMVCIIWLLVAVMSLIFFHFSFDPSVMIISGNMLLDGHILDYYEELEKIMGSAGVYPILCPLFYTIWNIPVRILTGTSYVEFGLPFALELWNKLLPVLFYVLTGLELGKIIDELNLNEDKYTKKVWFFMPISFFVVFIMGMYDIFYAFFAVVGLRFYFKDWSNRRNKLLFIFFFGIAICFKTFPLFFFIALLLSKEKNIRKIICDLIVFIIPYIICALPFIRSDAFINNCLMFSGNASGMLLVSSVGNVNVMLILMVLILGYSYFEISTDCNGYERQVIIVCNMIGVCLYGLSTGHFQWLVLFAPFLTLLFVLNGNRNLEAIYVLQIVLMAALLCVKIIENSSFEYFLASGLLGDQGLRIVSRNNNNYFTIKKILHLGNGNSTIILQSIAVGTMLALLFWCGRLGRREHKREQEKNICKMMAMLLIPILAYESVSIICYLPITPKYVFASYDSSYSETIDVVKENIIAEHIYNEVETWTSIEVWPITWANSYTQDTVATMTVLDDENNEIIYNTEIDLNSMTNNVGFCKIDIGTLKLQKNRWYRIMFSRMGDSDQTFALKTGQTNALRVGKGYLDVNGDSRNDMTLLLNIIGK